jgi:hypothetical protein
MIFANLLVAKLQLKKCPGDFPFGLGQLIVEPACIF